MLRTLEEQMAQNCAQLRWAEFAIPLEPDYCAIEQPFQHHAEVFAEISLRMDPALCPASRTDRARA